MVEYGMLIDTSLCIGCRACQVACKQWNLPDVDAVATRNTGSYKNPPDLRHDTWTLVDFREWRDAAGRVHWLFRKEQCRHCATPGCRDACPVPNAIVRDASGAVVVNAKLCGDCDAECYDGCPWHIPRFRDFDPTAPDLNRPRWVREAWKCWMCRDRICLGQPTACSSICPTKAVRTVNKGALMSEALARVAALQARGFADASIWPSAGYETNVLWILTDEAERYEIALPEGSAARALRALPGLGDAPALAGAAAAGALAAAAAARLAAGGGKDEERPEEPRGNGSASPAAPK
ncbi:MAG: 4Fe-4S dicluster domain-containing protein [Planctomycetes bacterium]|nr:4Fe-4S dicluster domain-containing protein [Planctomycetota bacterium]